MYACVHAYACKGTLPDSCAAAQEFWTGRVRKGVGSSVSARDQALLLQGKDLGQIVCGLALALVLFGLLTPSLPVALIRCLILVSPMCTFLRAQACVRVSVRKLVSV